MPLRFLHFCDLLAQLDSISSHKPPVPNNRRESLYRETITKWFHKYNVSIDSTSTDAVIVLSALLPARRTDRVYGIQALSLTRKLRSCLHLGIGRWQQLDQWKQPGLGDLGDCVERVQAQAEVSVPLPGEEVTLEEIDRTLEGIAQKCRFSAPSVKNEESLPDYQDVNKALERIYNRLQSREAKWFTRMILKDYVGLQLNEGMILRCLDSRLPTMMKSQDNFHSAVSALRKREEVTDAVQEATDIQDVVNPIPKIGVKVGRTTYLKGRSIKHAMNMIDGRAMSVERKYDGEYFQLHIDLTGDQLIQVFSKSGKDSTFDRKDIQGTVKDSLRIGRSDCIFSKNCILEGEMVIWSDETEEILDFYKIRKYISRSGTFLGTAFDSQPRESEHLMLIYYDVMLLDDEPVLKKSHKRRRGILEKLVTCIRGRAKLATRRGLDASNDPNQLLKFMAQAFNNGWEGLVLKPVKEPYFHVYNQQPKHQYASCWIKLKKDYIAGLGDTADFAVFGAGYNNAEAVRLGNPSFKFTHFHLGCLKNKRDVIGKGAKPVVTIFAALNQSIKPHDVKTLNQVGQFRVLMPGTKEAEEQCVLDIQRGVPPMSVIFKKPFVFEVLGSGFDKAPDQGFFTLRFPRVLKVHWDRYWKETVGFDELQQMADEAKKASSGDISTEVRNWVQKLKQADRGKTSRMTVWDDSQEELDVEEHNAQKESRRVRTSVATLVRIDTSEMKPGDCRMSDDDLARDENPPQTKTTSEKGRPSLPSSSSSSSRGLVSDSWSPKDPTAENSVRKRKMETGTGESSKTVKKTRTNSSTTEDITEESTKDSNSSHDHEVKPLQHIKNSARPRESLPTKSSKTPPAASLSLVPKMRLNTESRTARIRKPIHDSSSQCTTERDSGSTPRFNKNSQRDSSQSQSLEYDTPTQGVTTERTEIPETPEQEPIVRDLIIQEPTMQEPITQERIIQQPPFHLPAWRPTTPTPFVPLPNLQQSGAILCPCIAQIPYLLENLLINPPIPTSVFPPSPTLPPPAPPTILPPYSKTPIVLIEPNRKQPTIALIERLVSTMAASPFDECQLWDWRLLESLRKDVASEAYRAKIVRKRFFLRIVWGERRFMHVQWGNGMLTHVPERFGVRREGVGGGG